MITLNSLQEFWKKTPLKKGDHAEGNQYGFYEWFLYQKSETIKSTMLPSTREACGFITLNDVNGKEYVH